MKLLHVGNSLLSTPTIKSICTRNHIMSSTHHSILSTLVNLSCESFELSVQPRTPPNTPVIFSSKLPSYAQTIRITNEQEINCLNAYKLGCYSSFLGAHEEANSQIFYDPTQPDPLFPFIRNRTHLISSTHLSHHTDYSPIEFTNTEWEKVWKIDEFKIDTYLIHTKSTHLDILLPWTNEHEYQGALYRLSIDHQKFYLKQRSRTGPPSPLASATV